MERKNQVQLITYADSLGGDLRALHGVLRGPLAGLFGGVHILPFFPSSGDRGFSPIVYDRVDPAFGDWDDVRRIAAEYDVVTDVMVNHISRHSPPFLDFLKKGRRSEHAELFLRPDKVWPGGEVPPEELARIYLRKPEHPFSDVPIEETGGSERVWTTFAWQSGWHQVDLDVNSEATRVYLRDTLRFLAEQGIRVVRLDAVGYVTKRAGTSCFF
ncbi:MAG TPA: alpha-amylase family glycosyl hydrolase, partial [Anaerolineae bacterium]|nr:alpha-amylase family glycosyl hydrolase [Anaerolineae bacterium]